MFFNLFFLKRLTQRGLSKQKLGPKKKKKKKENQGPDAPGH